MNIFLSISLNICFGCSEEPSHCDGSFEYPQHMFWLRNKKINFLCSDKVEPNLLTYALSLYCLEKNIDADSLIAQYMINDMEKQVGKKSWHKIVNIFLPFS